MDAKQLTYRVLTIESKIKKIEKRLNRIENLIETFHGTIEYSLFDD